MQLILLNLSYFNLSIIILDTKQMGHKLTKIPQKRKATRQRLNVIKINAIYIYTYIVYTFTYV